jgi:LacI family transcriptional regulator
VIQDKNVLKENRPTIRDVAREASVSYQTVSRVLNESPSVAPATRQRVLRVMKKMGYQRNVAAQMLNTNRSYTIQIINLGGKFPFEIPLPEAASKAGYSAIYAECTSDTFAQTLDMAAARMVDGIFLYAPKLLIDDKILLDMAHGIPIVRRDYAIGSKITWVGYDQVRAAELAVQHLIDLGHRQIAEVTGLLEAINPRLRHETLERMLSTHGLEPVASAAGDYFSHDRAVRSGYEGMHQLIESGAPFTAIVVGNDQMAIGALSALFECGLRVPEDVSVVGFDNSYFSRFLIPPLTTVAFNFDLQSRLAFQFLFEQIENPHIEPHQHVLLPELIVRHSTRKISARERV